MWYDQSMLKILKYFFVIGLITFSALLFFYSEQIKNLSDQIASKPYDARSIMSSSPIANEDSDVGVFDPTFDPKNFDVPYEIKEVASGLFVPWSIAFTSENRALVTERNGVIREMVNGSIGKNQLIKFNDVKTSSEEGLMGLAVDPDYQSNKYLYTCYAYSNGSDLADKVVRLIDKGTTIEVDKVLLDKIPAASNHAGCRIKFGPDGMLYVTTGDATDKNIAQDLNSLGGKILRINKDGTPTSDGPFEDSEIYSYGHRNPQGIDWTANGELLESEHGPSGFDGPPGGDEINLIHAGGNYGWPNVSHDKTDSKYQTPLQVFTPAIAPGSLMVYKGDLFPQFKGKVFVGGLKGEGLYMISFENNSYKKVSDISKIAEANFGRIREVVEAPNGEIYFTTSNRDGRGTLRDLDDKIYKITVKK